MTTAQFKAIVTENGYAIEDMTVIINYATMVRGLSEVDTAKKLVSLMQANNEVALEKMYNQAVQGLRNKGVRI